MSLAEFCVSRDSSVVPPENWLRRDSVTGRNRVDLARIQAFIAQGFSLVIQPIDGHAPALGKLCDAIRAELPERIKAGVIVTEGRGGAFRLHYDPEDLLILQVEGSKRWRIVGPAVVNPVVGMRPPPPPAEEEILFDDVLRPGDALFVPAGHWHRCEAQGGRSMHVSIFMTPPTGWHAMRDLTDTMLGEDLFVRPASRGREAGDLAALEAEVKERAIARIQDMDMDAFLKAWISRR
jgi:ribosomal protein L16 Arg81 hydroxylase